MIDETERIARLKLRSYRHGATYFQKLMQDYKVRLDKHPHIEAELIVSGKYHKWASHWIAGMLAAMTEEDIQKAGLQPARNLTEKNWEYLLREHYSPFGVIQKVMLRLIMLELWGYERLFIENCWKLPKWKRPEWLREMEKDERLKIQKGWQW